MLKIFPKRCIHSIAKNAISAFKSDAGDQKFLIVQDLLKKNIQISSINSVLHSLMAMSSSQAAYRIFMIYVSSGRKLDGIDSSCFDYMINLLVRNDRMDEAESVIVYSDFLGDFDYAKAQVESLKRKLCCYTKGICKGSQWEISIQKRSQYTGFVGYL